MPHIALAVQVEAAWEQTLPVEQSLGYTLTPCHLSTCCNPSWFAMAWLCSGSKHELQCFHRHCKLQLTQSPCLLLPHHALLGGIT